jgi:hypothetical protein
MFYPIMAEPKDQTDPISDVKDELSDEEQEELEKRMKILLDEANQISNRFFSNIDSLHRKIITLFQIFLVLTSIEIVVITYHTQNGYIFSYIPGFLLIWFFCWGFFSFVILIFLLYPRWYKDVTIFDEKRFSQLCNMDSHALLSDFLHHTKEAYQYNEPLYYRITTWFHLAYASVIVMTISYIILIISVRI